MMCSRLDKQMKKNTFPPSKNPVPSVADPHQRMYCKYFKPKKLFKALGNTIRDVIPDPNLDFYPSRIQGSKRPYPGSRIRIQNTACAIHTKILLVVSYHISVREYDWHSLFNVIRARVWEPSLFFKVPVPVPTVEKFRFRLLQVTVPVPYPDNKKQFSKIFLKKSCLFTF